MTNFPSNAEQLPQWIALGSSWASSNPGHAVSMSVLEPTGSFHILGGSSVCRVMLVAGGLRLRTSGSRLCASGSRLCASGLRLRTSGLRLLAGVARAAGVIDVFICFLAHFAIGIFGQVLRLRVFRRLGARLTLRTARCIQSNLA
jgi:hypothetical protein